MYVRSSAEERPCRALELKSINQSCGRAGYYYLIIHLIFKFNLIIKFTIETILKCVKNKVYTVAKNSLFVRKALMLVYKLQDKLSPQTNEKYSFQY